MSTESTPHEPPSTFQARLGIHFIVPGQRRDHRRFWRVKTCFRCNREIYEGCQKLLWIRTIEVPQRLSVLRSRFLAYCIWACKLLNPGRRPDAVECCVVRSRRDANNAGRRRSAANLVHAFCTRRNRNRAGIWRVSFCVEQVLKKLARVCPLVMTFVIEPTRSKTSSPHKLRSIPHKTTVLTTQRTELTTLGAKMTIVPHDPLA